MLDGVLGLSRGFWSGVLASIVILGCYVFAVWSAPRDPMVGDSWSPLAITAGVFGRASLSNLQILFFSLVVFWIVLYLLFRYGRLTNLSGDVLYLLGIGAIGSGGAKVVALRRQRLSFENWAWLKRKGWIKEDIGRSRRPPRWADLVNSDGKFDVFKFQSIVVSLIVGFGLLIAGVVGPDEARAGAEAMADKSGSMEAAKGLAAFSIPEGLLGLLGLSQVAYIGGKVTAPAPVEELDQRLNKVRELEGKFREAVALAWNKSKAPVRDLDTAKTAALDAYSAFRAEADNALEMLADRIGGRHPSANTEPDFPG